MRTNFGDTTAKIFREHSDSLVNALGKTLNLVARSVQSSASPLTSINRIKDFSAIPEATKSINGKTYHKIQGQWVES
jgi:hypothetical protein